MKLSRNKLVYILIFGISLLSMYAGLVDYDYYWQAELGRYMVQEGNFNASKDIIWGTLGVSEYLDHEWLTNILFYFSYQLGYYGIFIMKLIIL